MKKKWIKPGSLVKLDRLAAWVLMIVILLYATTGFGMTKGFIDPSLARSVHFYWLGIIGLISFCIHTGWGIHMALRRWRIWNTATKILLPLFYLVLIVAAVYFSLFYQPLMSLLRKLSQKQKLFQNFLYTPRTLLHHTMDVTTNHLMSPLRGSFMM